MTGWRIDIRPDEPADAGAEPAASAPDTGTSDSAAPAAG
jgi:hypothetical protein